MQLVTNPTKAEIAWAAGFFEGEGYFTGGTHRLKHSAPRFYPAAGINNTDLEMLTRFHRIVGVGTIRSRDVSYSPFNAKPQWIWRASKRREVEHVRDLLLPWLSTNRRERLAEMFDDRGVLHMGRVSKRDVA